MVTLQKKAKQGNEVLVFANKRTIIRMVRSEMAYIFNFSRMKELYNYFR